MNKMITFLVLVVLSFFLQANGDGWVGQVVSGSDVTGFPRRGLDVNTTNVLLLSGILGERAPTITAVDEDLTASINGVGSEALFLPAAEMSFAVPQQIVSGVDALAASLENDPQRIYEYVRNHIAYDEQMGWLRSAERTLVDGSGSASDQSVLLVELLRAAGYADAGYAYGWVSLPFEGNGGYNIKSWLGSDSVNDAYSRMNLAKMAFDVDENDLFTFRHVWVTVTIDGTVKALDPSIKSHDVLSSREVADWCGYSRSNLLAAAGGTTNASAVWNLNESALRTNLNALAAGLISSLRTNAPNAGMANVLGGLRILPEEGMGEPCFTMVTTPIYDSEMITPPCAVSFQDAVDGQWYGVDFSWNRHRPVNDHCL